ncbi:MAG: HAMP domain-containing histidine kinase [Geminicoccaceae bacterium]|nr:HAMP domain-containing histidine kinase [Geminicoccaceae bacterium]
MVRDDEIHASTANPRVPLGRGLSTRILLLTVGFVLLGEVLIFVPSIARFRQTWLEERLNVAYLATLALDAGSDPSPALQARLLEATGAFAISVRSPSPVLMLGTEEAMPDRTVDLGHASWPELVMHALETLAKGGGRVLRVTGMPEGAPGTMIEILLPERPLFSDMVAYGWRILALSLFLSLVVAGFVFLALRLLIVRPLREITGGIARFRARPEDASGDAATMLRPDEIGIVGRELAAMRTGVRQALGQKTRLAALGEAVGKISHDLRAVLATAVLVSDRLEDSPDPEMRAVARRLFPSLERATRLCEATLDFARQRPAPPRLGPACLHAVAAEAVGDALLGAEGIVLDNRLPPGLVVRADRDQLYRVFLNLARNARAAMPDGGRLTIEGGASPGGCEVGVKDEGEGVPQAARASLFQPFAGGTDGGAGLGLAICREVMRNHGGDIRLEASGREGEGGTCFVLSLPARLVLAAG